MSITVTPGTKSLQTGGTQAFTATLTNDTGNMGASWTMNGANCSGATCGALSATTSASGVAVTYTAPGTVPSPSAAVTLTATAVADNTKTASAAITITAPTGTVTVAVSPKRAAITTGQTQTFAATVAGNANTAVTWEVDTIPGGSAAVGTINSAGKYTPPAAGGTHTIGARSAADTTVTGTSSLAVTDLAGVFTYHNNLSRDGTNTKEFALTTTNVNAATFGKLFSCAVDGAVYAQPLWVANVTIGGVKHNVLIAATEHDSVYAFDADTSPCATLWHANLLDTAHGGTGGEVPVPSAQVGNGFGDLVPEIGITGTPVIDPATNTIYVVSKSENIGTVTFFQRLHALDLLNGAEKFAGPANIDSSITVIGTGDGATGGTVPFDVQHEHQRPSLALANGLVYVAWASHEDADPYHGWVISFSASNLGVVNKFNDSPFGRRGGIWMSGGAPAIDSSGSLYVITGNGDYDGTDDFGDSVLKLSSALAVQDSFTPSIQAQLDSNDLDLGSGGAVVLIDLPSAPADHQHLLVGGGKGAGFSGQLYSLSRDNLGQFNASDLGAKQIFPVNGGIFATPAFWQNKLYIAGTGTALKAYALSASTGQFNVTATSQSTNTFKFPGATPSISTNPANSNGIVWAIDTNSYCTPSSTSCGPAVLHAYDATNLATELWNSSQGTGNAAGNAVKFTVPTVANGKVYIGTRGNNTGGPTSTVPGQIEAYGLKAN